MPNDPHSRIYHRNPSSQRGFTAVPNDLIDNPDLPLSAQARYLYVVLKRYAWKHGSAWPGQLTLAAKLNCSDRTIRTYLDELKHAGLLTVERRGNRQTNEYYLEDPPHYHPPENSSAPHTTDRKPASAQDRMPPSIPDRNSASDKEDSVEENPPEKDSPSTQRKECQWPPCHNPPAPRPPTARYCEHHGDPYSGYLTLKRP